MKKLLLVSHSQKIGGAEKCLYELASGLNKSYELTVTLPSCGENYALFESLNCKTIIVSYPWWLNFSEKRSLLSKLRKFLSQIYAVLKFLRIMLIVGPKYVISNTATVPAAAIAARMLGKKHYWFIHELLEEDHGLQFDYGWQFSTSVISLTAKKIFVNSAFVRSKYERYISAHKFRIINIDVPKPSVSFKKPCSNSNEINLYLIGQIQPGKGQLVAIKAHEVLLSKGYESKLHIIGSTSSKPYFEEISEYISSRQIERVQFSPFVENPYCQMEFNPIGLMCSEFEALGRVTIEYMKAGIPVVGCRSGETKNIIKDGVSGLLYENKDFVDLAEKIVRMHKDPELRKRIVTEAASFADKNFNSERFINEVSQSLNTRDE